MSDQKRRTNLIKKITRALQKRMGRQVSRHRRAQGLTLKALGAASGLHWRHVQKIERGTENITLRTFGKLVAGLRVDPRDLISPPRSRSRGEKQRRSR